MSHRDVSLDPGSVITSFTGQYLFLSNFSHSSFVHQGLVWPTAEHAYQAMKSPDPGRWLTMSMIKTPAKVKQRGRYGPIRHDWDTIKRRVMLEILLAKFSDNPELRHHLLRTSPATLIEGNTWGDTYWGAVLVPNNVEPYRHLPWYNLWDGEVFAGENWLGRLLMVVREVIS